MKNLFDMRKSVISRVFPGIAALGLVGAAVGLVGCSEDGPTDVVNDNYTGGMETVDKVSKLPECDSSAVGEQYLVREDAEVYVCTGKKWMATGAGSSSAGDIACSTESLKDGSGLKIVCNGDSIAVVLIDTDGKDDKDSVCCDVESPDDSEVVIKDLKLSGFSQKGPFVNGTRVLAYELANNRTLSQTGRSYRGDIVTDNGLFNIDVVSLASQYVILEGDGYYLNEVTGEKSNGAIKLNAVTDLQSRSMANINLLTHLEYFRVQELVNHDGMKLNQAKAKAEKELFKAFHIDDSEKFENTEDLNIFSEGDGNAALLAISILLQRDNSSADLTSELSTLSNDIKDDGIWEDQKLRAKIADWAFGTSAGTDSASGFHALATLRANVEKWGLHGTGGVPAFEKYISGFWHKEYGLEECNADAQDSTVSLAGANSTANQGQTLICDKKNVINKSYFRDHVWRKAIGIEKDHGHACNSDRSKVEKYKKDGYWYECDDSTNTWSRTTEIRMLNQERPGKTKGQYIDGSGETYYRDHDTKDSVYKWSGSTWEYVDNNVEWYTYRFSDSTKIEGMYRPAMVAETSLGVIYESDKWRNATRTETDMEIPCLTADAQANKVITFDGVKFICKAYHNWSKEWNDFPDNSSFFNDTVSYGTLEYADQTYRTVKIGTQTWMAENLNYDPGDVSSMGANAWHGCYDKNEENCARFGRLYTWEVVMNDSACTYGGTCNPSEVHRGICPEGWHIPTKSELETMLTVTGQKIRANNWVAGDDVFGVSFLPSGYGYNNGFFQVLGSITLLWSSSEDEDNRTYYMFLDDSGVYVFAGDNRDDAFSVRCVQDSIDE